MVRYGDGAVCDGEWTDDKQQGRVVMREGLFFKQI
jgi:hypothetical protein